MEQKRTMDEDMKKLTSIVNRILDVDIHNSKRLRNIVDARMVFSKIMYEQGYTVCNIGKFLGKNHSTIIHYIKVSDYIFVSYPELHDKYIACNEMYMDGKEPSMLFNRRDMVRSIATLNDRVRLLTKERNIMKKKEDRIKRFESIISLLENKVIEGKEYEAYRIIHKVLNGGEIRERAGLAQGAESY